MATLYLLTALSCAAIAWQPFQRTDLWEWMVWAARSAPYQNGDEERDSQGRWAPYDRVPDVRKIT